MCVRLFVYMRTCARVCMCVLRIRVDYINKQQNVQYFFLE